MTPDWFEFAGFACLVLLILCAVGLKLMHVLRQTQAHAQDLEMRLNAARVRRQEGLNSLARESHSALNGITGYAEYVSHHATDPMIQFTGTIIYENSLKLERSLDVMMDWLARDADGVISLHHPFSLRDCFEVMRREFSFSLQTKSVLLETHVDTEVPEPVCAQAQYVQKIVANLTENAIRFCHDGGRVRLHAALSPGEHFVHVRVEDNGPLLPSVALQNLLERDPSRSLFTDHMPLGDAGPSLIMTHQLVRAVGGRLHHTPTTDRGNMFHFFFPYTTPGTTP